MLDIKYVREHIDEVEQMLKNRNYNMTLSEFKELDAQRRRLISEIDLLRQKRNENSRRIGLLKARGSNGPSEIGELMTETRELSSEIKAQKKELDGMEERLNDILSRIPNMPASDVPIGPNETGNVEIRRWGTVKTEDFKKKPHWDFAVANDWIDFTRASKISGTGFEYLKRDIARLERVLIDFMIDLHVKEHGFTEIRVPHIVNRKTMFATGQLPKMEEDAYLLERDDQFLIPTAEIALVSMHMDEIIPEKELPRRYVAYSPCYRREAGSYGKDVRGMFRQHQFDKVELVSFSVPERSYDELEYIVHSAEEVLQLLEIPYRVVLLCTGDMGFTVAKTYDIEVWLPSYGRYREISSCSNDIDFQARRGHMRYRTTEGKTRLLHTLNGSGLAVGRTLIAILENYQNPDGSITIPKVLRKYFDGKEVIRS